MMKLGMHVDNWRHFDVSYQVPGKIGQSIEWLRREVAR